MYPSSSDKNFSAVSHVCHGALIALRAIGRSATNAVSLLTKIAGSERARTYWYFLQKRAGA